MSPVIGQKGEFEKGYFKKTKHAKFSKKGTFIIYTYVCVSGGKNCSFFGKFWDSLFALLPTMYFESLFNTLWIEIKQMLKEFPSGKINVIKNAFFFLSGALTHHSFIFNSQFLCELKHKVHLSKTLCGIFHF